MRGRLLQPYWLEVGSSAVVGIYDSVSMAACDDGQTAKVGAMLEDYTTRAGHDGVLQLGVYSTMSLHPICFRLIFCNSMPVHRPVVRLLGHTENNTMPIQCETIENSTNTIQYRLEYNQVQYNTRNHKTNQHKVIQCNTMQDNTGQYSTTQYNAVQYNT